jgi:hypothetical protein
VVATDGARGRPQALIRATLVARRRRFTSSPVGEAAPRILGPVAATRNAHEKVGCGGRECPASLGGNALGRKSSS